MVPWLGAARFASAAPVRVALVATDAGRDAGAALDLASATLSKLAGIEVLERAGVEKLLGEQLRSLAGAMDAESVVQAGRILRADVFAILETTTNGLLGGFTVLDGATAVRYVDSPPDAGGWAAQSAAMVRDVQAAVAKRSLPPGSRAAVCVLGAKNAELPRSMDSFCDTVAFELDRRLVSAASITTLDRRRLDAINRERALSPGATNELLPSLCLVELEFGRGTRSNSVRVTACVMNAAQQRLAAPSFEGPRDARLLTDSLLGPICEALKMAPPLAGDREIEAKQLWQRARFWSDFQNRPAALQCAEAAYALAAASTNGDVAFLARLQLQAAAVRSWPNQAPHLALINRAFDLMEEHGLSEGEIRMLLSACRDALRFRPDPDRPAGDPASAATRSRCFRLLGVAPDVRWTDPEPAFPTNQLHWIHERNLLSGLFTVIDNGASRHLQFPIHLLQEVCEDSTEFHRLLRPRISAWLAREAQPGSRHDRTMLETLEAFRTWYMFDERLRDAAHFRAVRDYCSQMASHPKAIVGLYGQYGLLACDVDQKSLAPADVTRRVADLITRAKQALESDRGGEAAVLARHYDVMMLGLRLCFAGAEPTPRKELSTPAHRAMLRSVVDYMFARGQLAGSVLYPFTLDRFYYLDREQECRVVLERAARGLADGTLFNLDVRTNGPGALSGLRISKPGVSRSAAAARATDSPKGLLWSHAVTNAESGCIGVLARAENALALFAVERANPAESGEARPTRITPAFVELEGGMVRWLGSITSPVPYRGFGTVPGSSDRPIFSDAFVATNGTLAVSSERGIDLFEAGAAGESTHWGIADGLPADSVRGVALVGDELYAGCASRNQNYFVRIHLTTRRCEVLSSTLRVEKQNALDLMCYPDHVQRIIPDPPRRRLLLAVHPDGYAKPSEASGIWEFCITNRAIRQLARVGCDWCIDTLGDAGGSVPTCATQWRLLTGSWPIPTSRAAFNPSTDRTRLLYSREDAWPAGAQTAPDANTYMARRDSKPGMLFIGDWYYSFSQPSGKVTLTRTSTKTRTTQTVFEDLLPAGAPTPRPWTRLEWFPKQEILVVSTGSRVLAICLPEALAAASQRDAAQSERASPLEPVRGDAGAKTP